MSLSYDVFFLCVKDHHPTLPGFCCLKEFGSFPMHMSNEKYGLPWLFSFFFFGDEILPSYVMLCGDYNKP